MPSYGLLLSSSCREMQPSAATVGPFGPNSAFRQNQNFKPFCFVLFSKFHVKTVFPQEMVSYGKFSEKFVLVILIKIISGDKFRLFFGNSVWNPVSKFIRKSIHPFKNMFRNWFKSMFKNMFRNIFLAGLKESPAKLVSSGAINTDMEKFSGSSGAASALFSQVC